jgi:D-glycero-D-manno-heptose 1,7-bisphosphate phosphatase
MKKAVFLDRDGVINRVLLRKGKPSSPRNAGEFDFINGIGPALRRLKEKGLLVIVATNQPDIARGRLAPAELEKMHNSIRKRLPIDDIFYCPHDDNQNCSCRKPKPGMLIAAARKWGIDLNRSFLIGDSRKDLEAGKAAGCTAILIRTPSNRDLKCEFCSESLAAAAELVLKASSRENIALEGSKR